MTRAAQIRSRFGAIPAAASPKPRPDFTVPDQPGTIYSIVTDPEVTQTAIRVLTRMPARDQSTVGAYRKQMAEREGVESKRPLPGNGNTNRRA